MLKGYSFILFPPIPNEILFLYYDDIYRVSLHSNSKSAILELRNCISRFGYGVRPCGGSILRDNEDKLNTIIDHLSLADLNRVLFRCASEEQDEGKNRGVYVLSKVGAMPYCGLQGFNRFFLVLWSFVNSSDCNFVTELCNRSNNLAG